MRPILPFSLSLTLLMMGSMAFGQTTLDDAFRSALRYNESVLIERAQADQTDARVSQARSAMLPNITGYASTVQQSRATAINGSTNRRQDQTSARVTLTQPLFAGGRYKAALDQTKLLNDSQRVSIEAARASLYLDVAGSYYEVLAAEADLKNLQTSVELTEGRIKELQKRARIGRSRSGEVLTGQSQLEVLRASVQEALDRVARARQNFAFQTGLEPNLTLGTPELVRVPATSPQPLPSYLDKTSARPDIKALELQTQAAQSGTSYARAGHMPTLELIGNGYWTKDASDRELEWDIGLGLTIPLFEGGAVQGRVREAKAKETEAELNYRRLKRSVESEVTQAHQSLASSIRQVDSLQEALTSSEKNYREQTRDYSFGLVTNIEVLQALNTLQETRRSLDRTKFESLLHWAELKAATHDIPADNLSETSGASK